MNRQYNLKLDLQFRCNNSTMKFSQFDNNTSDFFMRITNGGNLVDIEKAIVVLVVIKPSGKVSSQFIEVENGLVYADLKPSMVDEIGTYTAQAMLILEDERVVTDPINYEVNESKILSAFIEDVGTQEEYTLLADMLSRLSTIEISEEQRQINEADRILSEENRKIEEAKRVEAEQRRKDNYIFMVEDEERRRSEANAHKEAEILRVQAETNRVNEEAKRRTTEQARVLAENTRVDNENLRKANEVVREKNEEARQNTFTNKVSEVDKKIVELNTTKDNFISSVNTKVDSKISEIEIAKNDITNTVSNKVNEVETRFNALTSKQQQDAEVIDARDNEISLKARLDRDIEKAKEIYVDVEGSYISTDSSSGYLKDIEILGNTIQDINQTGDLADIRSVGDKVEGQELHEIPVLSVGENVFNNKWELGGISSTGEDVNSTTIKRTDFIKIGGSNVITPCMPKYVKANGARYVGIIFYDKNRKYLGVQYMGDNYIRNSFVPPVGSEYVRFTMSTTITECEFEVFLENKSFVSQGNLIEPTPYIEDKLTILSPTPLEKVGDVADRIICKDGVWGVEKNIVDYNLTKDLNWVYGRGTTVDGIQYFGYKTVIPNPIRPVSATDIANLICNYCKPTSNFAHFSASDGINTISQYTDSDEVQIMNTSEVFNDVVSFKNWISDKNISIKYQTTNPTFIPLPHSQQVKLRTFASKTNISFLTEIEGTIKAQVPKSLGATVNTHTEQISNLNKELDRVKKLEESTVSTVETESDFTTVEATSNGYFEDVKLEGKTLVNILPSDIIKNIQPTNENFIITSTWLQMGVWNKTPIKPNTTYTIIVNVIEKPNNVSVRLQNNSNYVGIGNTPQGNMSIGINVFTSTTTSVDIVDNTSHNYLGFLCSGFTEGQRVVISKDIILLEGDHTQNPPSYFEGLKSVGDTTDEIVVSSVNENLCPVNNDVVNTQEILWYEWGGIKNAVIPSISKSKYKFYLGEGAYRILWDSVENASSHQIVTSDGSKVIASVNNDNVFTVTRGVECVLRFRNVEANKPSSITNCRIVRENTNLEYTTHKSDKKRLLYYNNETQTWEKPILRQWDSIEKHADGKYYYHQRSGEVVLNGSENGWIANSNINGVYRYELELNPTGLKLGKIISNKFIWENNGLDENDAWLHGESGALCIRSLIDNIVDFKQWLQANNVTVVYQLAQEKVYECSNMDLITYANETNYIVECGAITPKTTLKVHNNISNVVGLLQKKVSLLESNITSYMITQNRLMLASRYSADTVSFKVDVASYNSSFEYDNDLYELILNNILVGKDNYNREYIENLIIFYWMDFVISDEMYSTLFELIEEQHNPKVIEEETPLI